ncbi:MAG: class I SAM-dependent methyltransferase [Burkholderiales bacterium]
MTAPAIAALLDEATHPYRAAGRYAYHFARGKLRHDPAFRWLLSSGMIPSGARVLDIGCGQGVLLSMLLAARRLYDAGTWPDGWPAPPERLVLRGIDLQPGEVRKATKALGDAVSVETGDVRDADFPESDVVVILDVLHYIDHQLQKRALERIADALAPGGRLLLRIADANAGWRFVVTHVCDRFGTLMRGELWPRHRHRPLAEWIALLNRCGLDARAVPMSEGTPFANVLLIAEEKRTEGKDRTEC